jgi:hypothetical protein
MTNAEGRQGRSRQGVTTFRKRRNLLRFCGVECPKHALRDTSLLFEDVRPKNLFMQYEQQYCRGRERVREVLGITSWLPRGSNLSNRDFWCKHTSRFQLLAITGSEYNLKQQHLTSQQFVIFFLTGVIRGKLSVECTL